MTVQEFITAAKIPKHLKGCEHLENAIILKMDNPKIITEDIYIELAKKAGVSIYAISANIRRAIYESYEFMDESMKQTLFPDRKKIPANGMYITNVAYSLRKGIL